MKNKRFSTYNQRQANKKIILNVFFYTALCISVIYLLLNISSDKQNETFDIVTQITKGTEFEDDIKNAISK